MNGLLASLRFPVALRGLRAPAAAVPGTAATRSPDPFRTLAHPEATQSAVGLLEAPPLACPLEPIDPVLDAAAAAPALPVMRPAAPVAPSVAVSAAHLVDPVGVRVVPFRPSSRWPLRRAAPRIYDPFRGFPLRSMHLADLMYDRTAER